MVRDSGDRSPTDAGGPLLDAAKDADPQPVPDADAPAADAAADAEPDGEAGPQQCPEPESLHPALGEWERVNAVAQWLYQEDGGVYAVRNGLGAEGGSLYYRHEFPLAPACLPTVNVELQAISANRQAYVHLASVRWPGSDGEGVTFGISPQGAFMWVADDCFARICTQTPQPLGLNADFPAELTFDLKANGLVATVRGANGTSTAFTHSVSASSSRAVVSIGIASTRAAVVDRGTVTISYGN